MWENIVEWDRPQMAIWRMRIACWVTKATNKHSEYVILVAFPIATVVARKLLNVTLLRILPALYKNPFSCYKHSCGANVS